jgi:hypothetical protein
VSLGEQSDPDALANSVRRLLAQSPSGGTGFNEPANQPPTPVSGGCGAAAAADAGLPAGTRPLLTAGLSWRGQPAEVTVFDRPAAGGRIAIVTAVDGCSDLAHVPI